MKRFALLAALVVCGSLVSAQEWNQWRGPLRNGSGKGPGYASPVVVTIGGVKQIVTMTNGSVEGIDARTGASLWSTPFPDQFHENIVTPIWTGTHLIVSSSAAGMHAYALTPFDGAQGRQAAGKWQATEAVPALLPNGLIVRDASGIMRLTP